MRHVGYCLNKLHTSVKKLDALLTERETGVTSWWIMLGNLVREINDAVFADQSEDVNED